MYQNFVAYTGCFIIFSYFKIGWFAAETCTVNLLRLYDAALTEYTMDSNDNLIISLG